MIALRSLIFNICYFGWTLLLGVLYLPLLLTPRRTVQVATRFWLAGFLVLARWICNLKWELRNPQNLPPGPLIVASKHQSAFETLMMHQILDDPAFILKKELLHIPFVGWYMAKTGMIAVDRAAGSRALRDMASKANDALAAGRQVVIFPEGTRVPPGETGTYHPGVAYLYANTDAPVVPVALNSGRFWARKSFLKYPGTITVEVLEPIPQGLDRKVFMETLKTRIEDASRRLVDKPAAE